MLLDVFADGNKDRQQCWVVGDTDPRHVCAVLQQWIGKALLWFVSMCVARGRESVLLHHPTQGEAVVVGGGRVDKGRRQCYQGGQDEGRGREMHDKERRRGWCGLVVAMGAPLPPRRVICFPIRATYILT